MVGGANVVFDAGLAFMVKGVGVVVDFSLMAGGIDVVSGVEINIVLSDDMGVDCSERRTGFNISGPVINFSGITGGVNAS